MRQYLMLGAGVVTLIIVGSLNVLAFQFYWYWLFWWLDLVMHTLTGLGLGLLFLGLGELNLRPAEPAARERLLVSVVVLVMVIGVAWEFFEFTTDRTLGNHLILKTFGLLQQGAGDTASDILCDFIGAGLAAVIFKYWTWPSQA